ncbi:MAG: ATPase associated with various cellular activities AAA_5, partial [Desulfotomaculum sp. 46_296]
LMIGELVAVGVSIRDAIIYSLQTDRDHLESILLTMHMERKDIDAELASEFVLFR